MGWGFYTTCYVIAGMFCAVAWMDALDQWESIPRWLAALVIVVAFWPALVVVALARRAAAADGWAKAQRPWVRRGKPKEL